MTTPSRRVGAALRVLAAGLGVALCAATTTGRAAAQEAPPPPPAAVAPLAALDGDGLTAETVRARRDHVATSPKLDEAQRAAALAYYDDALAQLAQAEADRARVAEYERLATEAPALLESIRAELATPPTDPVAAVPPDATLRQLEALQDQAQAELAAERRTLEELQVESSRRADRRRVLPDEIAQARRRLGEIEDQLATTPVPGLEDEAGQARRVALLAQRQALQLKLLASEKETAAYDARTEVLPARRDRAARRVAQLDKLVSAWQQVVSERRRAEAESAAREAERYREEITKRFPALAAVATDLADLSSRREGPEGLSESLNQASARLNSVTRQLAEVRKRIRSTLRRVLAAGLTDAMGLMLRKQLGDLPDLAALRRESRQRQRAMAETQIQLVTLDGRRDELGDPDEEFETLVASVVTGEDVDRDELASVAHDLLARRRTALDDAMASYQNLFDSLTEVESAERELIGLVDSFRDYISERIFWVRSIAGPRWPSADSLWESLTWLLDPLGWTHTLRSAARASLSAPVRAGALLLGLLVLLAMRGRARATLARAAEQASSWRTRTFGATLRSGLATVVLAAGAPAALFAAGWWLAQPVDAPDLAAAAAAGLHAAAAHLLALTLLWHLLRPNGLGRVHFTWPEAAALAVRRPLGWFTPLSTSATFVFATLAAQSSNARHESLGRLALAVAAAAIAVYAARTLRRHGPVMEAIAASGDRHGWITRLHAIWFPILVLLPLTLVVLAAAGFHDTAQQLYVKLVDSLWLVLALAVVNGLLMRWLALTQRDLALEQARARRQAARDQPAVDTGEDTAVAPVQEPDLRAMDAQTRQLFRAGYLLVLVFSLSALWGDALPGLELLRRVEVWPTVEVIPFEHVLDERLAGLTTAPEPPAADLPPVNGGSPVAAAPAAAGDVMLPGMAGGLRPGPSATPATAAPAGPESLLTLADVAVAIVLLLATLLTVRNLPALLEMILLQRLPLDPGSRYAAQAVTRYAVAIIGVSAAFAALGIGWAKIQWLAAALTFGLAFGLQEIFANFVSGLIILIERPVRLGDIVTVGEIEGRITRLRIRATTITDWDRRELLVPNKSFITEQVINWTLTDAITREVIPVGIAYGSDVEQARRILLAIAEDCEWVVSEPPPSCIFRRFEDSSLRLELRVFLPSRDVWAKLMHDLHSRIHTELGAAGIEIAFPQRDLHLRSVGGLSRPETLWTPAPPGSGGGDAGAPPTPPADAR